MASNWPHIRLGEVVEDVTQSRIFHIHPYDEITDPTINTATHTISASKTRLGFGVKITKRVQIEPGDLVFSRLHTQNGAFAFSEKHFQATETFVPLRVNVERINKRFLFWALHTFVPFISASDTVGRETFKTNNILSLEIPIPSLVEQESVVKYIEELAARIQEVSSIRKQAMEDAGKIFDAFLDETFRSINDSGEQKLYALPEVADIARGRFGHRPRNEPRFYGGDIPFIQIGDISNSNRYIRKYSQTLNQEGLSISRMFPSGTVVIAITGATIGVTGILTFDSCFPDSIVGIVVKPKFMIPEFVYLGVEYAKKTALAGATQSTQPNINLGNIKQLMIPTPPISEQRKVVAKFDKLLKEVDALEYFQEKTGNELDSLMPSLLDRVFKGEL